VESAAWSELGQNNHWMCHTSRL